MVLVPTAFGPRWVPAYGFVPPYAAPYYPFYY
jgi:hypothetical protein